ncbi:MAG: T9SS C-terminal target domain-containing protein [Bacteroidetes bacterium]|nr:MAG: T9SS C-terminal target domain-containing protein [Bacteroidota bacterium]
MSPSNFKHPQVARSLVAYRFTNPISITMQKRLYTLFSLLVLLWALPTALSAQQDCISGTVFEDLNNNGVQDAGENGIPGLIVTDLAPNGPLSTSTDADGNYQFCNLREGLHFVHPELGGPPQRAIPANYSEQFVPGNSVDGRNFGIVNDDVLGTVSSKVFYDLNRDGVRQEDEPPVIGATVTLEGDGVMRRTTTDGFGCFRFTEVASLVNGYLLRVDFSDPNTEWGSENEVRINLPPGGSWSDRLFWRVALVDRGSLADRVCYDLDANGQVDPLTEPGIPGITVIVENDQGEVVATTGTSARGDYQFVGLPPGNYRVNVLWGNRFTPTTPTRYDVDLGPNEVIRPGPFYGQPRQTYVPCGGAIMTFYDTQSGRVMRARDIRDCSSAPTGVLNYWSNPPNPLIIDHPDWTFDRMGAVFGLTTDADQNVYVAASRLTPFGAGLDMIGPDSTVIFLVNRFTGAVSDFVLASGTPTVTGTNRLQNNNSGLGNLSYNNDAEVLYAVNLEDNTLNVIGGAGHTTPGQVLQSYAPSFTSGNRGIWAVGYNSLENRVYFSQVAGPNPTRIHSLAVNPGNGLIIANSEVLELDMPPYTNGANNLVTDIAFGTVGNNMLLAERAGAHSSRVFQVVGGASGNWNTPPLQQLYVGSSSGANCTGGVDYGYGCFAGDLPDSDDCETKVLASGNALILQGGLNVYGMAIIPASGNGPANTNNAAGYANLNSILIDIDEVITTQLKGRYGDVEVFDCPCERLTEPTCADENGLEILPNSPVDPAGVGDCCHLLDFSNVGNVPVHAIDFTLLDGVQFQPGYQWDPAVDRVNYSSTSVTLATPGLSGPLPNNINGIFNFCLENITAVPQFLVVDYRDRNFEIFCTDTLEFRCPLQAECLEFVQDSLVCDSLGYKYTIDFEVPPGTEFDVGYIKMNLTQALPAGTTWMPIGAFADPANSGHVFPTPLVAGDQVSLMYMITTTDDLFGDSLCILVTAHDDLEERLCCFAYEACVPYPDCPMPCEEVDARVVPAYQGDAAFCCGGDPLEYQWLQDLIGDCTQRPCGAEVFCCELEDGTRVIRISPDPAFDCADFPEELYGCDGTLLATGGGIAGEQLPPLFGCRKIYDCFEPELDECCFDLLLTDTFTADPGLITAIQTTILNTGVTFSGQDRLGALLNGWTPTDLVPDRDILWTHNSGVTPNGVDQYLFSFCVEGTTSTDSVYVEVDFLAGRDSIVCTDTVAVYCPYCLQIVNDSLTCVTDPAGNTTYLYQFSFINSSAFDVNAVYISDQEAPQDTVLNPGLHLLGSFVPPGATYTGTIPVEFDTSLDSACFDIVLRQIIGDSINISCCYATHCIELPPCDTLPRQRCPLEPNPDLICLDVYEPVCGCDDQTYANICYAERAGVITWTPGPCDDIDQANDDINLVGQAIDPGNQLNWTVNPPPRDYVSFLVQKWEASVYWTLAQIPATGDLNYEFLDVNAEEGLTTYRILATRSDGTVIVSNSIELLRRNLMGLRTTVYSYPSPARDELNVTVNRLGPATIELLDTDGQITQQADATFNGNPHRIDVSRLQNGVFIVRVRFDDGEVVQQRVVRVRE